MSKAHRSGEGSQPPPDPKYLMVVGGTLRGRRILYHGDPVTRPMKHRVREAIFNLVGTEVAGRLAIDVFAGTGALGIEALSRGAKRAVLIERHLPTARVITENLTTLDLTASCELLMTSAFLWAKRDLPALNQVHPEPWLVFISPPYDFFVERQDDMLTLVSELMHHAPAESTLVVESDDRFDFGQLPAGIADERGADGWRVRAYPPAVVGVWRKSTDSRS